MRGRFVELGDDRVLALSEHVRAKLERLERLGTVRSRHVDVHPLAAPALDRWLEGLTTEDRPPSLDERLAKVAESRSLRPNPPRTLKATLRDYQHEGYRWMRRLVHWGAGPLLCDDMGLGKTVQILALLLDRTSEGPALVVAPTSVCAHWEEQAHRFAPGLAVRRFGAGDRASQVAALGPRDVLLSTYGLLQRESELLSSRPFAVAVLDEAQAIKNARSLRARAAHGLDARVRVVSTGTPLENHLGELWSLFHFANPHLHGSHEHFGRTFARPIHERGDSRALDTLRQLVRPFVLRRTKAEVLEELPAKTEITLRIEPSSDEVALYEALRRRAAQEVDSAKSAGKRRMQILTALTRLRQAACHPRLVGGPDSIPSSKHETLHALIDELREGGHRALVFSQFVEHLRLVRENLDARGIEYRYLDGSTPAEQRRAEVQAFQDGGGELFLISLRAGGTGLDLTAADYVIHLDPWWNPAVEAQASDRAHRIGQERPVTIYRLVTAGTVEERILALHGEKRSTAERLLDGTDAPTPVDLETLRSLVA
jgi:SNF2 family DNA or RNA helicase